MNIKTRLLVMAAIPLLALLAYAMVMLVERKTVADDMAELVQLAHLSVKLGNLAHELQKERGRSAGFIGAKGQKFASELQQQRADADKAADDLKIAVKSIQLPATLKSKYQSATAKLDELSSMRSSVSGLQKTGAEAIAFYSSLISQILDVCQQIVLATENGELAKKVVAYVALLHAKEFAGQERATLSNCFAANKFTPELYKLWITVMAGQSEYADIFSVYTSPDLSELFRRKLESDATREVEKWRSLAFENSSKPALDGDAGKWFAAATARIDLMKEVEDKTATKLIETSSSLLDNAKNSMLMVFGLGTLVAGVTILLTFFIIRSITRPLTATMGFARQVAAGNLDVTLSVCLRDEVGMLCDALRQMVANLKAKIAEAETQTTIAADETQKARKAMGEAQEARQRATAAEREGRVMAASKIETVASTLTQNARALEDNVKRSRHGAEVQKERVTETATAMEEMNATVLEVAGNASRAAQSSDVARHTAQNGAAIVARVVTAINDVRTQAISLTQNISQLGQSAQAIGQIIGVINDIADQTNLLALNAAIEAARAGEAGRGFAVVADEVRKLAEKTMSATGEVGKAIRGIQDLTRVNVDNVEKAVATIETVSTLANESGASLRDIVNLVEESSMQVAAIATAAEEQSAASNEINRSVLEVHNISTETADGMEASSRAVADVNHEIESLRNLIRELQR